MNTNVLAIAALLLGSGASLSSLGCGPGASPVVTGDMSAIPDMTAGPPDLGPRSVFSESEAQSAREACTFKSGALPGTSLARDAPLGPQIPIDTIIVVMMENRSFDHLLGNLKNAGQPDADVAALDATNPDENGVPVSRYHDTDYCFTDTNHGWAGAHAQYDGGKNDGFVITNVRAASAGRPAIDGHRAMSYYTEADIPFTYALANTFAVADRYFCGLLGPTFPNREYLYAATSFGNADNQILNKPLPNLMELLESNAVPWHVYSQTIPGSGVFLDTYTHHLNDRYDKLPAFFDRARAGTLEHVVFLDPDLRNEIGGGNDFHPPGDVQNGDAFFANIVNAAIASPQWPHMAIFLTFDEHGGLYDHVPPPSACPPDALAPIIPGEPNAAFDRYGFRVPAIVVSPYVKPHFVSHKTYSHTSVVRFIESRFILPAITARDANADPMFDVFDFSKPSLLTPPTLPAPVLDMAKLAECKRRFPGM